MLTSELVCRAGLTSEHAYTLPVDVRTSPFRFLVSWLEEVSASRMKMRKERSGSSEMNSHILRGLELLRGSFESEEEEIFLPPRSNRQLSIHIQQVSLFVLVRRASPGRLSTDKILITT